MNLPEVAISFGAGVVLLILLLAAAIVLTVLFYRITMPPISPAKRVLLAVIRSLALLLLLLLLFEPILTLIADREQRPVLAVLADDSESMTIKDRTGDRAEQLRGFLKKDPFGEFRSEGTIAYFRFASDVTSIDSFAPDSLRFTGETTNLAAALEHLRDLRTKENIQATVLLTDGNFNVGRNPLSVAEELAMPVFTVGIGDTTEQRDVLIAAVATNNVTYAETRVPVDLRVRSSGFQGERLEVTLAQRGTILDRRMLQLQEGTREYPVSLSYTPSEEGVHKYTVHVSALPGELTTKNNTASFFVKVLKTKLRILIIAGAPSPDLSTVRQILGGEEHFTVRTMVQKQPGEFYEGTFSPAAVDSADCLVLVGYPSAAASSAHVQELHNAIVQKKKPLLFIHARTIDYSKLQMLDAALPFSWTNPSTGEILVFPAVPERQARHALVHLEGVVSTDGWHQLPPVYKAQTVFRSKPESEVLAFVKLQSVVLTEPLVVSRKIARQKSLAVTGHGIWRWRMLVQGNPATERFLPFLLTNAVRWLTTFEEGKNVHVVPTKDVFTSTEPVEFTAQVYDEQYRPVDAAEVRLEVSSERHSAQTILRNIGSGRYEGGFDRLAAGEYGFIARAIDDGTVLGEDRGKFSVGQMNVEFLETRMNKPLLEQLAFRTGGFYFDLHHADALIDSLHGKMVFLTKRIPSTSRIELWNWQYLAGALVLLFALEWIVRKRSGML